MSQENVACVRRWLKAISGDSEDFDRALALVHPDVVFFPPGDQPPYRGAESLRRWMEPDAFQEQVVKTFEPVVVTDTTVLGRQLVMARGAASGIERDSLRPSVGANLDLQQRGGHPMGAFRRQGIGPRSRRAVRVGDVAGERRDRAALVGRSQQDRDAAAQPL